MNLKEAVYVKYVCSFKDYFTIGVAHDGPNIHGNGVNWARNLQESMDRKVCLFNSLESFRGHHVDAAFILKEKVKASDAYRLANPAANEVHFIGRIR